MMHYTGSQPFTLRWFPKLTPLCLEQCTHFKLKCTYGIAKRNQLSQLELSLTFPCKLLKRRISAFVYADCFEGFIREGKGGTRGNERFSRQVMFWDSGMAVGGVVFPRFPSCIQGHTDLLSPVISGTVGMGWGVLFLWHLSGVLRYLVSKWCYVLEPLTSWLRVHRF